MNSKELVSAALRGLPAPRVPTGPLAVHFCAGLTGCTLGEYTTNPSRLADSVIRYCERFRPDAVWVSADTWVSAQAMGARVGATDDNQPFGGIGPPAVRTARDIDKIPAPDVGSHGRYPLMLEALSRIARALGKEVFVVACFDQYPFSLAASLMGINEMMLALIDDPPFVRALMERCLEYTCAYGAALSRAGADMLSGGDSPAGLVGPELYAQFGLPGEQRVLRYLKSATGKPASLHICGNTMPILPLMKTAGADVLELDSAVTIANACRVIGPDIALWGNLDPVRVLAQGGPNQVASAVSHILAEVRSVAHPRFVLSSGCTLAVETPYRNLDAFFETARCWHADVIRVGT